MHPTSDFLAAARGDAPPDHVFRNARIVNVFTGELTEGSFAVHAGRFSQVFGVEGPAPKLGEVDLGGAVVAPGFIDAHMHVESTMMPPSEFVKLASPHGTTAVVADPHEIANVLGADGIKWMMRNGGGGLPVRFLWSVSSCVPSCHLESSGARLGAADLAPLFDLADEHTRVVALAEMMNFPGVVFGDAGVLDKVRLGLARRVVDGHAPGLTGARLQAYVGAGISSDHECTTLQEAREKLRLGMRVFIRQGSAAQNLAALLPLVTRENKSRFCFCTDDRHPADLKLQGHIDHVVRLAVKGGLDPVTAITMASLNVAEHYRQSDLGAVAPGRWADFIVLDSLENLTARQVYAGGVKVAEQGRYIGPTAPLGASPASTVRLPAGLSEASFRVPASGAGTKIRVIGMDPRQLVTDELIEPGKVEGGCYVADPSRDILKLAVIERHKGGGNIGRGFIRGFKFGASGGGAMASTVGHDSHNLAVVGASDADMLVAARALERAGGGQCVVRGGKVLALLPLPIAGLMSDQPAETLIEQQHALHAASREIGCPLEDPFMPLSFMPLPVIPKLKLSDLGLVDVEKFQLVPLEV